MFQVLLLNSTYECIAFISDRKAFKLISKEKVEVISTWENKYQLAQGKQANYPAVIRLNHQVRWIPRKARFNRMGVFRRDMFCCQYCGAALTPSKLTWDHILPRTRGGVNSWRNCVTCCFVCNNKKGNRTPEEAGMKLLLAPSVPKLTILNEYRMMSIKHPSWEDYVF